MPILKPPTPLPATIPSPSLFLAGSIEMGKAENWQKTAEKCFDKTWTILNPRRDDWDSSWKQSIDNEEFKTQVTWELDGQEGADYILIYFSPNTISPISLAELGLFHDKITVVVCPEGFERKGNVDIICQRYGIHQENSLDDAVKYILDLYDTELENREFGRLRYR